MFQTKIIEECFLRDRVSSGCELEILLGAKLDGDSCLTELFVETAPETTTTLFEKIIEIRKQFLPQIKEDCGSTGSVKRLNKDSSDQKTRLFPKLVGAIIQA